MSTAFRSGHADVASSREGNSTAVLVEKVGIRFGHREAHGVAASKHVVARQRGEPAPVPVPPERDHRLVAQTLHHLHLTAKRPRRIETQGLQAQAERLRASGGRVGGQPHQFLAALDWPARIRWFG